MGEQLQLSAHGNLDRATCTCRVSAAKCSRGVTLISASSASSSACSCTNQALAKVFLAMVNNLPVPSDCPKQWVVDCKETGNGEKALIYLGRYLYRGVIREQDILQCRDGMSPSGIAMPGAESAEPEPLKASISSTCSLLHILPRGFRRARSYG